MNQKVGVIPSACLLMFMHESTPLLIIYYALEKCGIAFIIIPISTPTNYVVLWCKTRGHILTRLEHGMQLHHAMLP